MKKNLFGNKKLVIDLLIDNRHSFLNSYVSKIKKIVKKKT